MTDNEKLARWQGWKNDTTLGWCSPIGKSDSWFAEVEVPDYLNDDAAAMSLLDTLVEKGVDVSLEHDNNGWVCCYIRDRYKRYIWEDGGYHTTRREAVVAAVLELIEKEAGHDV